MKIAKLRCKVSIVTGSKRAGRDQPGFARPALEHKKAPVLATSEAGALAAERATEHNEQAAAPARLDPRAVANEVYELMKREVQVNRRRMGR